MRLVNFNDLRSLVGQEVGASPWHEITQSQVNKFAEATGDHQWIHVDVERATRELGGPIAHGYLTLSLLPMLAAQIMRVENVQRGINFGCNKVRFTNMVPVGSRVRLRQKCLAVEARAGGKQVAMESTIEIDGKDRPACVAESIGIIYGADIPCPASFSSETCAGRLGKPFSPHDFIVWALGRITSPMTTGPLM